MKKFHLKSKLAGLAGTLILSALLFTGIGAAAAEPAAEPPVSQSEPAAPDPNRDEKRAKIREFREQVQEKWDTLSEAQKQEIYDLAEARMNADIGLMQKLAEAGFLDGDHVSERIDRMQERMKQLREAGECPLSMGHRHACENPDSHS